MEPTWVLSAPDGFHVGPMNLAIRDDLIDDGLAYWGIYVSPGPNMLNQIKMPCIQVQ